jgi:hypothetical protein
VSPDVREIFREQVITHLRDFEPQITEQVLQRVDMVPAFDDVDIYIAVAAMVLRAALAAALQPTFARLTASEAAARAEVEIVKAFQSARTSKTVH